MTRRNVNEIYTMTVVYAETYDREAEAAKKLADAAHVKEHIAIVLPFYKDLEKRYRLPNSTLISSVYIPARNIVFYGIAAAYAETLGADRIVFGSNADDSLELPDATSNFVQLMNRLIKIGTRMGSEGGSIEILNPLLTYSKTDVLKLALKLKVPLEFTWSCHKDGERPCGQCRGCRMRLKAFESIGMRDPLIYA